MTYNRNKTLVVVTGCHEAVPSPTVLDLHLFSLQFAVDSRERELLIVAKDTHASANEPAVKLFIVAETGKIEATSSLLAFDANHLPQNCQRTRNGASEYLEIGSPERFILLWTDPDNPENTVLTVSAKGDSVTPFPFEDGRRFLIADATDGKMQLSIINGRDPTMNKLVPLPSAVLRGFPYEVVSDGWPGYDGLVDVGFNKHIRINKQKTFAKGRAHINGIEAFRSFTKRRLAEINGVKTNFPLHLKECEWRYNKPAFSLAKNLSTLIKSPVKVLV